MSQAMEIFKRTAKTNCKECGFQTCMSFAVSVANDVAQISLCPYIYQQDSVVQSDQTEHRVNGSKKVSAGAETAGVVYGNVSNASTLYGSDKFATPRGHGFAAEQANHLYDKITNADFFGQGKVQMVGEEIDPSTGHIVKNGADRIVNGTNIQTKFCKTGAKCISECFDGNGDFRYKNADGTPMQIEVPSDKYDDAVKAMENRIKEGKVPRTTDPKDAKKIVKKSPFSYEQAKNIAKAGTVESITFDAANGAIIATSAFGISTVLSFATSIWNGDDFDVAIKNATYTGLKVGGTTFITAVLSSQLSKAGLNSALVGSSEAIVRIMGPKASAMLVNAFRSGTNIYGAAAMKSAAKLLRGNAITGAVSVVVLSSVDVVNIFRGRISGKQLFKNVANTAVSVAGGTAGWVGGATVGATIGSAIPIVGTAIGGFVGGLIGSFAAGAASSKVSNAVLGAFIEDDADEMVRIIEKVFQELAVDYLLSKKEAETVVDALKESLTGGTLKDMYASSNRKNFARNLLIGDIEIEVKRRKKITMPSDASMQKGLREVLEELSDEEVHGDEAFAPVANSGQNSCKKDAPEHVASRHHNLRFNGDEKYARALAATLVYFAKCDGSVCDEEQALLDNYWSVVNKSKKLSTEAKQEIAGMPNLEFSFDQITEFLDDVKVEELSQIKELVRKIIISSGDINDVEKQEYFKLVHYDAQRTK